MRKTVIRVKIVINAAQKILPTMILRFLYLFASSRCMTFVEESRVRKHVLKSFFFVNAFVCSFKSQTKVSMMVLYGKTRHPTMYIST